MATQSDLLALTVDLIDRTRKPGRRALVAIAGPPGSGKSTLASDLINLLRNRDGDSSAALLPMDGFHLENDELSRRGLLAAKGAPDTFDVEGFVALMRSVKASSGPLSYPLFDRMEDRTVPGGGLLRAEVPVVLIEGNYLLLQDGAWASLKPLFDATVMLSVPIDVLRKRLIKRWLDHGLRPTDAVARADGNDMVNAITVTQKSAPADLTLDMIEPDDSAVLAHHMRP